VFYIYADGEPLYYPGNDKLKVLSPKLTLEMGKAGALEFDLLASNPLYAQIRKLKTIVTVEMDDTEIFRGRVLSYDRDFNNTKKVYCEGDLAYLVDSVIKGEKYEGTTRGLFQRILNAHNARVETEKRFALGTVNIEDRSVIIRGQSESIQDLETGRFDYRQIALNSIVNEWKTAYDYISECLIDYCGGYLRTRRVSDVTYLDYVTSYGRTASQNIHFGENILDLSEEVSAEELFTVLIPLGDDNLTIASVNNRSDELVDAEAVAQYGRIIRTHVFDSVTAPSTLLENGRRFLSSNGNIPNVITINGIDLHLVNPDIEEIYVGDVVNVVSAPHSISGNLTCSKIEYDLVQHENTVYTFGMPRQTLTERYRKDIKNAEDSGTNAGSSGGGGSGGAASDETDDKLEHAYAEWVNWDPANPDGHVSLGTLWQQLKDAKIGLKSVTGIDLDSYEDYTSFNIFSRFGNIEAVGKDLYKVIDGHEATIKSLTTATESKLTLSTAEYKKEVVDKIASIELSENANGTAIAMKADKTSVDTLEFNINQTIDGIETSIASFTSKITTINSDITKVRDLIADQISAIKANVDWLNGKTINASELHGTSVIGNYIYASSGMYVNNNPVATQSWVNTQGFLKDNDVSWGTVNNGFVYLNVDGTWKYMAMANHTHSQYLTALPSHRHSFYGYTTIQLASSGTRKIVIQGNTGYAS